MYCMLLVCLQGAVQLLVVAAVVALHYITLHTPPNKGWELH
jgi:hypothetical protein